MCIRDRRSTTEPIARVAASVAHSDPPMLANPQRGRRTWRGAARSRIMRHSRRDWRKGMAMTGSLPDVREVVAMHLVLSDASVLPIRARLTFEVGDPYTVRIDFTGAHSNCTWLIGRELIAQGVLPASRSAQGSRSPASRSR